MEEMLKPYLAELLELVKNTGSFIIGELPAISKEIIMWGIIGRIIPIVVLLLIIGILVLIAKYIKQTTDVSEYSFFETCTWDDFRHWQAVVWIVLMAMAGAILVIWFIVVATASPGIFKAIFAPRLFLIEQLKILL